MSVMLGYALYNSGRTEEALRRIDDAVANATTSERDDLLSQALGMRTMMRFLVGDGFDEASLTRARRFDDQSFSILAARPGFNTHCCARGRASSTGRAASWR